MSEAAPVFGKRIARPGAAAAELDVAATPSLPPAKPAPEKPVTPPEIELPESWRKAKAAPARNTPWALPSLMTSSYASASFEGSAKPAQPRETLTASYASAWIAGFIAGLLMYGFVQTANGGSMGPQLYLTIAVAVMTVSTAPFLAAPIRALATLARQLAIPRGFADMAIGGLIGATMILPDLMTGHSGSVGGYCFTAGGLVGGFVFWRGRGFPKGVGSADPVASTPDTVAAPADSTPAG